jgi:hypothetical protein
VTLERSYENRTDPENGSREPEDGEHRERYTRRDGHLEGDGEAESRDTGNEDADDIHPPDPTMQC